MSGRSQICSRCRFRLNVWISSSSRSISPRSVAVPCMTRPERCSNVCISGNADRTTDPTMPATWNS